MKYFLLVAFIMLVLLEVVLYFTVRTAGESKTRENLTRVGREVTLYIDGDGGDISAYLDSCRQDGINVYILSPTGEILLPSNGNTMDWTNDIDGIKGRLEGFVSVIYKQNRNLIFATKIDYNGESYLVASYSLTVLNSAMNILLLYFVLIGVVVLLITAFISYSVSGRLSAGLKSLSSTAVRFSKGDFEVRFANAEYQELADLSDTLNSVRDEVKKSSDFQKELVANVSHDLKTPLTMIKAYASMIKEISGDNPEKRDKHLQVIIDEADRLTGLVNDVLSVSKLQANMTELKLKVFNLTELVYGIINKFGYLQEAQGYSFMLDIEPNLYTRADEEKISQVIYNLLGNAASYTGEDKTVYISLNSSMDGKRVRFSVKDTGKGIPKENLPEIWDRYYRVKENHNRPVKGTGLGLNIVKAILESHSFDFGVESEVDKGSLFWVDFPGVPAEIEV